MKSNRKVIAVILMLIMVFSIASLSAADECMNEPLVKPLVIEGGTVIGTVTIWNDCDFLYVEYELNHCAEGISWEFDETDVFVWGPGYNWCGCKDMKPMMEKGVHEKFVYNKEHECGITEYTYEIPMKNGWHACEDLMIGATAIVDCIGTDAGEMTYYSDSDTMVIDGSIVTTYPYAAVEAYPVDLLGGFQSSTWDAGLDDTFDSSAMWIWGTEVTTFSESGEEYMFEREFIIPGSNPTGELKVAADNGYAVFVNDAPANENPILLNGLGEYPDLGDYTESYVSGLETTWKTVKTISLDTNLNHGMNTLWILGVNEQMNGGTVDSNPAGLKYEMTISWDEIIPTCEEPEFAWVEGEPLNCSHDMMVFPYTLFCICCDDEGQEQIKPEEPQKPMMEEATDEIVVDEVVPVEVEKSMAVKNANGRE